MVRTKTDKIIYVTVSYNKFRSLVGVLSEGRVDAFSQNPKSVSSSKTDSEG